MTSVVLTAEHPVDTGEAGMDPSLTRVVYLLGAGATHGSAKYAGVTNSLVMEGLGPLFVAALRHVYMQSFSDSGVVRRLINEVIQDDTDFEHLITFLEDAPSHTFRLLAAELNEVLSTVLRSELERARQQIDPGQSNLYDTLLDMYRVTGVDETLVGFMTLNYDQFLEESIESTHRWAIDYGIDVNGRATPETGSRVVPVLKLHGSFGWKYTWPVRLSDETDPGFWIPPGIRKAKSEYPFNSIWGAARELLSCDVLRIIGARLTPNDWDLVSLLFTTMHGSDTSPPYRVEVIDWPHNAEAIQQLFPYLDVYSLLDLPEIGELLMTEIVGTAERQFRELNTKERQSVIAAARSMIDNPFEHWLRLRGDVLYRDLGSISTDSGIFEEFLAAGP